MAIIYSSLKKEDQITVTQTTYEQIISKRQLVNICSNCEWYDICKIKEEANVQSSR